MGLSSIAKKVIQENEANSVPIAEQFCKTLDSYMVDAGVLAQDEHNANRRTAFNPSGYYGCARAVYYNLLGFPATKRITAISERWTGVGTAQHRWVQDEIITNMSKNPKYSLEVIPHNQLSIYGQEGIEIIEEHGASPLEVKYLDYRFTKKIPISAMVDGAVTFKGRNIIFEFKTIKQEKYNTLFQPLKEHKAQGALYSLSFGMPVMFLYISKNTQEWVPYYVEYSSEQLDWVKTRIQTIEESVLNLELPLKEDTDENCKYCGFKKFCKKDTVVFEPKKAA